MGIQSFTNPMVTKWQMMLKSQTASTPAEISAVKALYGEIQNHAHLPVTIPGLWKWGFPCHGQNTDRMVWHLMVHGTVESIAPDGTLRLKLDNERSMNFDPKKHPHLDHGYAVTSYSSQPIETSQLAQVHATARVQSGVVRLPGGSRVEETHQCFRFLSQRR